MRHCVVRIRRQRHLEVPRRLPLQPHHLGAVTNLTLDDLGRYFGEQLQV